MKIYRNDILIFDAGFDLEGSESFLLMDHHTVSFKFEGALFVEFEKGDYITHEGTKFYLKNRVIPEINNRTNGYIYDLTFYDLMELMKDFLIKLDGETDFEFTGTGEQFIDLVVSSFKDVKKGDFPQGIKNHHFENMSVFDGLNTISEIYETDWWLNGDVLNISKCEFGDHIVLRNDYEVDSITTQRSSMSMITRLYAKGSNKNIPNGYSKDGRLKLKNGYIDLVENLQDDQVIEGVKIFEDVFPKQENQITEVSVETISGTPIYTILGNNTFAITADVVMPGKPLMIAFTSGYLDGKEFELIIRENNRYEIKFVEDGDLIIPNEILRPVIGDQFFFFNFNAKVVMPSLIEAAENELLIESRDFLNKIGNDLIYNVKTRSIYCEDNNIDLAVGQIVTLESDNIGTVTSRVQGYEKNLLNKHECTYQIGDYSKYSRLKLLAGQSKSQTDLLILRNEIDYRFEEAGKNTTFFAKPKKYKKGDTWFLLEDTVVGEILYKKGTLLQAVYETGTEHDWRQIIYDDPTDTTDGINLIRNYDLRYGFTNWGGAGQFGELTQEEFDSLPKEFYTREYNVLGDEYGYEYALSTDDDELIILDE